MRDVMLISPSGRDERFMGMDMHMEHHNKAQQVCKYCMRCCIQETNSSKQFCAAHGIHGDAWKQLRLIAPLTPIFQPLKDNFEKVMGTSRRGSNHTTPDYSSDVWDLMTKNNELSTHKHIEGREASIKSINALVEGSKTLRDSAMAAFHNRYKEYIHGGNLGEELISESDDAMEVDST